jgi:radical SAM superfamily enzyme YgiQ (UPF0313 family)
MDCVIVSVPFTDTIKPLLAPALLKAQVVKAGFTAKTYDLNAELRARMLDHKDWSLIVEFYKTGRLDARIAAEVEQQIVHMADRVLADRPRVVAISVFTYDCRWATRWLAWEIRRRSQSVEILLGGAGLLTNGYGESEFGKELVNLGIANAWIRGDGDITLPGWLQGRTTATGIMTEEWQQHSNQALSQLAMPDYHDYSWDLYVPNAPIGIYGSRGCVRACTFCDVHSHWPKFTWRTGDSIFEEMLAMFRQYGRRVFHFQDSLINGNLKEYRRLVSLLSEYNQANPEKRFTWHSFFIMRPESQFGDRDWQLTAESGAENLMIGVESLHEPSRYHIGKHFSNKDLEYGLSQIRKWNQINPMRCSLLMIIGYILETEQDQTKIKQWFRDHAHYRDIMQIVFSPGLGILANTPLHHKFHELGLRWVGPDNTDWANKNSDPATRARWYKELYKLVADELGFRAPVGHDNHYILERMERGKFFES